MKSTRYFSEVVILKRPYIKIQWIEEVLRHPTHKVVQEDGRIRYWGYIIELGKFLRVVTLDDGQTVHNVFPDRDFRG